MTALPFADDATLDAPSRAWRQWLRWSKLRPIVLPLLLLAILLGAWQGGVQRFPQMRSLLSSPSDIGAILGSSMPLLLPQLLSTAREAVMGFALAAVIGVALGAVLTLSRRLEQALFPHLVLFQIVPKIALAPLFVIWFGVGGESRLVFALFLAFFPIAAATAGGLARTRPEALRLCAALTASRWRTFVSVRVPFAIPSLFAGLKMGMTMALIGTIVGEFVTGQQGLGYIIMFAASNADSALTFAALGLLCLVGLSVYGAVVLAEFLAQRWYGAPFATEGFT
ncbi:ABC transporter permease [Reyranella sp.]|uniref:ABC transporter permease n=1 Tax=Reyranella sp. TaxID=1929291 RepID=UPI003D0ADF67